MTDEGWHAGDRRQYLLGGIVDTFSAMELRGQILLAGFVLQELVGEVLAADLTFKAICQKLGLLSTLSGLAKAGDDLRDWARRASKASERRNSVVHSLWYLRDLDDTDSGARFKLSTRGKPSKLEEVFRISPETEEEPQEYFVELNQLALDRGSGSRRCFA